MLTLDQRLQRLATARLYAIVDTGYVDSLRVSRVTEQLVAGGVDIIQLRAKKLPLVAIASLGREMREIAAKRAKQKAGARLGASGVKTIQGRR